MDPLQAPLVHCPYLPVEKREAWWVYICDKKQNQLLAPQVLLPGLKASKGEDDDENDFELPLKFRAPERPGIYQYTVCVRSDSYLGIDELVNLRMDVREAPKVTEPIKYSDTEDEEGSDEEGGVRRRRKNAESESSDEDESEEETDSD